MIVAVMAVACVATLVWLNRKCCLGTAIVEVGEDEARAITRVDDSADSPPPQSLGIDAAV